MKTYPLALAVLCFVAGLCVREYLPDRFQISFFLWLIVFLVFISGCLTGGLRLRSYALLGAFFSLGFFVHTLSAYYPHQKDFIPKKKESILFEIDKKLNSNERNRRYEVRFFSDGKVKSAVLSVPKSEPELDFVHYYKANASIQQVSGALNAYQFDYRNYLQRKGIFYQIYLPEGFASARMETVSVERKIKQQRLETLDKIDENPQISLRAKQLLKGIILADRTEMDAQIISDFTKTGLVHILAISGSHMVIIFFLVYAVLSRLFSAKYQKWAIGLSLVFIWSFTVFIDYGNSVVRSCIMLTVYYIYVLLQRNPDLIHSMALAAFLILCWDSHQIFDVGFQLSFSAVFGIYWLNEPLQRILPYRPRNAILRYMQSVITITLSAQIATFPFIVYYFHQFPLISLVANFVAIPVAEGIIIFSLIITVLLGFGISPFMLDLLYDKSAVFFLEIVHWFGSFRWGLVETIPLNIAEAVLLCVLVYLLRFVLISGTIKHISRFSFVVLVFFAFRLGADWRAFHKKEILVHATYKGKVFSVKDGDKIHFWISEDSDRARIDQYIIKPYLCHMRARQYSVNILPLHTKTIRFGEMFFDIE